MLKEYMEVWTDKDENIIYEVKIRGKSYFFQEARDELNNFIKRNGGNRDDLIRNRQLNIIKTKKFSYGYLERSEPEQGMDNFEYETSKWRNMFKRKNIGDNFTYQLRHMMEMKKDRELFQPKNKKIKIISISVAAILALGTYTCVKNNGKKTFSNTGVFDYKVAEDTKSNELDRYLRDNFDEFYNIFEKILNNDYENISEEEIDLYIKYSTKIAEADFDNSTSYYSPHFQSFYNDYETSMILDKYEGMYDNLLKIIYTLNCGAHYDKSTISNHVYQPMIEYVDFSLDYIFNSGNQYSQDISNRYLHGYNMLSPEVKIIILTETRSCLLKMKEMGIDYIYKSKYYSEYSHDVLAGTLYYSIDEAIEKIDQQIKMCRSTMVSTMKVEKNQNTGHNK